MPEKKVKPVGRPKFPKGKAKTVLVQARVQDVEKKRYMKVAEAQGKELSTWIRDSLNRCADHQEIKGVAGL